MNRRCKSVVAVVVRKGAGCGLLASEPARVEHARTCRYVIPRIPFAALLVPLNSKHGLRQNCIFVHHVQPHVFAPRKLRVRDAS